ncbi:YcfL family protein [Candidatus Colwellia aromaticivorans]|uniref:YcfL family protein n=1 Tax=Candidatus Colwellia aromaticivorans TaxID=2267621 RepID=UPI000DF233F7|nr:YcfL family protein [Candidatus Colwellia aromaticivorans]
MSFIKNLPLLLLLLLSVFFISACKNVPPVTSGIGSEKLALEQKYSKHLQVHNKELASQLHISEIKSRKQNDLLQVNLSLTSTYKKSLQLQYQFQWFDKDGFVIEAGKSPWQSLELHGMQTQTVSSLAPTPNVATFSLYVRKVPEKYFKY